MSNKACNHVELSALPENHTTETGRTQIINANTLVSLRPASMVARSCKKMMEMVDI